MVPANGWSKSMEQQSAAHGTNCISAWTRSTGRDIDDDSQVATPLDQVDGSVGVFLGDGAYDSAYLYAAVEERHPDALVIVPSRAGAVASERYSALFFLESSQLWRSSLGWAL